PASMHHLTAICTYLPSLTSINITISPSEVPLLLGCLSQLPALLEIALDIQARTHQQPHLKPPSLPQLASIKVLTLNVHNLTNHLISSFNLPWTMPNLQILDLRVVTRCCGSCRLASFGKSTQICPCFGQILTSLKRNCTKLHKIFCMENNVRILTLPNC